MSKIIPLESHSPLSKARPVIPIALEAPQKNQTAPQSDAETSSDDVARIHDTPRPNVTAEVRRTSGLSSNAAPRKLS